MHDGCAWRRDDNEVRSCWVDEVVVGCMMAVLGEG